MIKIPSAKKVGKQAFIIRTEMDKSNDNDSLNQKLESVVRIINDAQKSGRSSCIINVSTLFSGIESMIPTGIEWIITRLDKEGYETYPFVRTVESLHAEKQNDVDEFLQALVQSKQISMLEICWPYVPTLFQQHKTQKGKRRLTIAIEAIMIFIWLNVRLHLPWYLDYLKEIDIQFIAVVVMIWLGTHIPSYLEQRALYNKAFESK